MKRKNYTVTINGEYIATCHATRPGYDKYAKAELRKMGKPLELVDQGSNRDEARDTGCQFVGFNVWEDSEGNQYRVEVRSEL